MGNFWENPLKPFEKNKISFADYVRKEHYQDEIVKRFMYNASDSLYEHYKRMKLDIYVFSEEELKELLTR